MIPGVGATKNAAPTRSTSFTVKRPQKRLTQKPLSASEMLRPRREGCAEFPACTTQTVKLVALRL